MNRKSDNPWGASLLAFAVAVFIAGCSGSSGSDDGAAATPPDGAPPAPGPAAPPPDTELAAFVRAGMTDPEYAEPRVVNDVTFVTSEQEAELDDWF
jgi:hypothetical protein